MSSPKPGRYGLRLTKAREQRMKAHATYQPQTLLAFEEREPLSQSPSIRALAQQRELANLGSKAVVSVSATGEGIHIVFNEDDEAPKAQLPRPADSANRPQRNASITRRLGSIPHIHITGASPTVTPQNSMTMSMRLRSASVASVVSALPEEAFLTPRRWTPTFHRTPNAPVKKVPGRATPIARARSPSPPIVRAPLERSPSVSPFITSSTNTTTTKKSLFPKRAEQTQRRKSARLANDPAKSTVADVCQAQRREVVLEQVAARHIRRQSRSPSVGPGFVAQQYGAETRAQKHQHRRDLGGNPGPDFSPDPAYSSQPRYQDLEPFFPKEVNNAQQQEQPVAGPSRQRRMRIASPTPGPARVQVTDPTPTISLAERRLFAARRGPVAQGPVWATDNGRVLVGADGQPEQPQPEEIRTLTVRGLGPNGTEQFDGLGARIFQVKETVQRGSEWYFQVSAGSGALPTLEEE
ncbi:unnamed protein product [Peniophora sp. CBMAI 1063]|nr:unnamed protein product [Peniophora sp. CBMAI 1063]